MKLTNEWKTFLKTDNKTHKSRSQEISFSNTFVRLSGCSVIQFSTVFDCWLLCKSHANSCRISSVVPILMFLFRRCRLPLTGWKLRLFLSFGREKIAVCEQNVEEGNSCPKTILMGNAFYSASPSLNSSSHLLTLLPYLFFNERIFFIIILPSLVYSFATTTKRMLHYSETKNGILWNTNEQTNESVQCFMLPLAFQSSELRKKPQDNERTRSNRCFNAFFYSKLKFNFLYFKWLSL